MSNQREVFSKNLRSLIDSRGIDQKILADYLGTSEMSVSNWVNGAKYPRMTNIQRIADYFGVLKSDIIEDKKGKPSFTVTKYDFIPAKISAGLPIEVDGITEVEQISIPDALMGRYAGQTDIYITRINGESMNKVMQDGSLIAVKPVELHELKENDIVVYSHNHDYGVKRFFKSNNEIWFRPHSTDFRFKDDIYNEDNLDGLQIHGKVVLYIVELD